MSGKVLIVAVGTASGDGRPPVALAATLVSRGYQVAIATHTECRELVQGAGATFFDIGMCIGRARAETDSGKQLTSAGACSKMSAAKGFLQPLVKLYGAGSLEALRTFSPDVVVLSTLAVWMSLHAAVHVLGDTKNIFVYHMMPMVQSSQMYPCITMAKPYPVRCGCMCNLTWWITGQAAWPIYREPLLEILTPAGVSLDTNPFKMLPELKQLLLYSPALFNFFPGDWSRRLIQVLGSLPGLPEPPPPPELRDFVQRASEKALVYLGLGSMLTSVLSPAEQASVLQALRRAAEVANVRAVIQCPANSLQATGPDQFLAHGALPHRWLFPQCRVVVTHGGAGTVHSSLACGCPVIVVSCESQSDQPFWGEVVRAKGVGLAPMTAQKLGDGRALAAAISQVLGNEAMGIAAKNLGVEMSAENGASRFADFLGSA